MNVEAMGIARYLRHKMWRTSKVTVFPEDNFVVFDTDLVDKLGGAETCLGKHVTMVSLRPTNKRYAFLLSEDTDETRMLDRKVMVFEGGMIGFVSSDVDMMRILVEAGYSPDIKKPVALKVIRRKVRWGNREYYEFA